MRRLTIINFLIVLGCALAVGLSWQINHEAIEAVALKLFRAEGRSAFTLIQTARHWNAIQGKVYVPVSADTPPNPYLRTPDRDITDNLGRRLTQVNPAYMTRQISELLQDSDVQMRITSLDPINPLNRPDGWEAASLRQFEISGELERVERVQDRYRYISGLIVQRECMQCHEDQGYRVGDLRGGISFSVPAEQVDLLVSEMQQGSSRVHALVLMLLSLIGVSLFSLFYLVRGRLQASVMAQAELQQLVERDELTGVLSRRALMERLFTEMKRRSRYGQPLSLLMLDLDHFKRVNDRYGHQAGDLVLKELAQMLEQHLREVDIIGRYGGEEFTVLLPNTARLQAERLAQRLCQAAAEYRIRLHGGDLVQVTLSIGLASCDTDLLSAETLLARADEALYVAKQRGRNRVSVYGQD
ncbi:hypothetical protein GCM10009104_23970 [Marinobacterium maritimum]|uniref:diguanylate cyclase n=1 Tax=Marinobacterium maritimum TaxID=500162 RepID=A0ABP3TEF0_9GAMM